MDGSSHPHTGNFRSHTNAGRTGRRYLSNGHCHHACGTWTRTIGLSLAKVGTTVSADHFATMPEHNRRPWESCPLQVSHQFDGAEELLHSLHALCGLPFVLFPASGFSAHILFIALFLAITTSFRFGVAHKENPAGRAIAKLLSSRLMLTNKLSSFGSSGMLISEEAQQDMDLKSAGCRASAILFSATLVKVQAELQTTDKLKMASNARKGKRQHPCPHHPFVSALHLQGFF